MEHHSGVGGEVVLVVVHSSGRVAVVSWQERLTEFAAGGGGTASQQ